MAAESGHTRSAERRRRFPSARPADTGRGRPQQPPRERLQFRMAMRIRTIRPCRNSRQAWSRKACQNRRLGPFRRRPGRAPPLVPQLPATPRAEAAVPTLPNRRHGPYRCSTERQALHLESRQNCPSRPVRRGNHPKKPDGSSALWAMVSQLPRGQGRHRSLSKRTRPMLRAPALSPRPQKACWQPPLLQQSSRPWEAISQPAR